MNHVKTWVDSEARAKIDATLKVTADLSFFGEVTLVDAAYNIFDKSTRSSSNAARYLSSASWSDGQPSSITSYKVGGVETDLASCLDAPPVILPEVEVRDPKEVAGTIIDQTYDRVVPCNIRLCDPNTGTRNDCDWDTSTNSMSCTDSGQACNCEETNVDMCALDGAGNITAVYEGTPVGQNYCDQKAACGGKQICNTSAQCGSAGNCNMGCCEFVK